MMFLSRSASYQATDSTYDHAHKNEELTVLRPLPLHIYIFLPFCKKERTIPSHLDTQNSKSTTQTCNFGKGEVSQLYNLHCGLLSGAIAVSRSEVINARKI